MRTFDSSTPSRHGEPAIGFLLSLFVGALLIAIIGSRINGGLPTPAVHDEFGYLLAAETFAQGKLAMPPHTVWQAFESFHILTTPAYAAKYPPAQSVFLAVGIWLGQPIYGVWISTSLLAAAVGWMLFPLGNTRVAYGFGIWAALWFGGLNYWAQSFWGGAPTALGAVLVWGGLLRLDLRLSKSAALGLGAGAALLFLSRPFEGFLACLVPAALVAVELWKARFLAGYARAMKFVVIAALPLLGAFGFQGAINHTVTGSAFRFPYQEYNAQYESVPILLFQDRQEPKEFNHPRMEQFDYELRENEGYFPNPVYTVIQSRLRSIREYYLGIFGIPLLIAGCLLVRSRWIGAAAVAITVGLLSVVLVYPSLIHYYAALVAPLVILLYFGANEVASRCAGRLVPQLGLILVAMLLVAEIAMRGPFFVSNKDISDFRTYRQALIRHLAAEPGQHLVLVRYTEAAPSPHAEYVYNGAAIDEQTVVWARWSEWGSNVPLFEYFKDRRFWMLEVGQGMPELRPFEWRPADAVAPLAPGP